MSPPQPFLSVTIALLVHSPLTSPLHPPSPPSTIITLCNPRLSLHTTTITTAIGYTHPSSSLVLLTTRSVSPRQHGRRPSYLHFLQKVAAELSVATSTAESPDKDMLTGPPHDSYLFDSSAPSSEAASIRIIIVTYKEAKRESKLFSGGFHIGIDFEADYIGTKTSLLNRP